MTSDPQVRIQLLGGFEVVVDGAAVDEAAWPGRRPAELVQLLALSDRRELLRDQVLDALWPHLDPEAGAANLRKAAHHARQAIGLPDAVVLRGGRVALLPDRTVAIDAIEFENAAARAATPEECSATADAWGGELLPGSLYEEWNQNRRVHLREVQLDLVRRAERWRDVVALDPTDEAAYHELMNDALDRGARASAIRWYGQLRAALARELGVGPDEASEKLYRRCLDGLSTTTTPLVGRAVELATVEAALNRDARRSTAAVAIRGAPGIGKSALCRAVADLATSRGWSARLLEAEEGSPAYGPLKLFIEEIAVERQGLFEEIDGHARRVLAALTPAAVPCDPPDDPLSRHQVIGAMQQLLRAAAGGAPVVLILDDAHLADDATIEIVGHMATTVPDMLIVLAHRDLPATPALNACLGRIDRTGRLSRIELGPLDAASVERLVVGVTSGDADRGRIDAIVERARGNPFVAAELARADDPASLSAPLSEVIVTRLIDVDDDTLAILRRVALVSDDLDAATIVALTGDTEDAALDLIDRALEVGVLVVTGSRYRFRHDLVRQALIEQVPPHQRAAVHRDVARRLTGTAAPAAAIARHWLAGGDPDQAADWSRRAATEAMRLGAFADARRHVRTVLDHDPTDVTALRIEAEALDNMGDPASLAAYDAAIETADVADRHDLIAMRALAQLKLGDPPGALETIGGVTPTSVAGRLSEALTYAGAAALGFADPTLGTAKAAECRRIALRSGDTSAIVVASWAHAAAAHARGELHDSVLDDLRDTRDTPHLASRVFDGQLCITQRFLYGARPYDDVITFADALADEGARLGAARGHAFGVTLRGEAELLSGRLDDAEVDLVEGGRLHRALGGATGQALALQRLAELELRRGDRGRATGLLSDALELARLTDIGFHLLDRIYGTRIELAEDPDEALALVDEAEEAVRGPLETCPGCRITFAVPAAIACARAGQLERARELETACEFLAHVVMKLPAWNAAYDEVRAHVAMANGDRSAATALLTRAASTFASAGHLWDRDRCLRLAE